MDKDQAKLFTQYSKNFQLHVGILQRLHPTMTPSQAVGRAYNEGPGGLNALLPGPNSATAKPEAPK